MPQGSDKTELLAVFAHTDALTAAVREALAAGAKIKEVYSPAPLHEVDKLLFPRKSPVRFVTFSGAVIGFFSGMGLALVTSIIWNLIVGGKPVTSTIPFLVVGFELTILFGALGTLLALLFFARLPYRQFPAGSFRPAFTLDQFGLLLECQPAGVETATAWLLKAGAVEVLPV